MRGRDPEALATFFERYFDRVFGLVYRLLGDRTQAEDVTQEVFLKVHRAADRIDPARDPAPWLMTIAHNACRDVWRSNAYRMSRKGSSIDEHPALSGSLAATGHGPEGDVLASERERLVQSAIGELPEPLRASVLMHDYEGLGHEQIADIVGIRHAAARKRYSRAIAALAALLKDRLT